MAKILVTEYNVRKCTTIINVDILWGIASRTFNHLSAQFIYLATSTEYVEPINWPTAVKGEDFMKKWKR